MDQSIVIVGAGQAGVQSAETLRNLGFSGSITMLGDEPYGPYHRPPLSKAWLAGEMQAEQLAIRSPEVLARKSIVLRTGVRVHSIDRSAKALLLDDGSRLAYTGLVLATGSTPRSLTVPGAQAQGVMPLRSRADADALLQRLQWCASQQQPLVVIGGGFIGLEVAATARKKGVAVTVLEAAPRLLGRVLAPMLSQWYAELHQSHGVELVFNAQIAALQTHADGTVAGVRMQDGYFYPAGLVLVGIGVQANDALAAACGLPCERGIVVDDCGRTADPAIVAAGDCTVRRHGADWLRLESVQNANEQAKSAAAALMGQEKPFLATPWFWSDQYDKKLQMAGLSSGADQWAVRGTLESGTFSVYHFKAGGLVAVDSVNSSRDHLTARKLLDAGVQVLPIQVTDPAFDLASLLKP